MSQFDQVVEQGKFESLRWRSAGQREADKHQNDGRIKRITAATDLQRRIDLARLHHKTTAVWNKLDGSGITLFTRDGQQHLIK